LEVRGCSVRGEVLLTDRFGNVVTSIGRLAREENKLRLNPWLMQGPPHSFNAQRAAARLPSGASLPLAQSFGNVDPGEALSYIGSDGMLEIAVNRGHAADYFGLSRGDPILLECEA
jgi:S-adenosylmethionine hydrolase